MKYFLSTPKKLRLAVITSFCLCLLSTVSLTSPKKINISELEKFINIGIEHVKKVGPEKAYKDFSNPQGKYISKGKYFFIYDYDGKCLAHGGNPKYVGQTLLGYTNKYGVRPVQVIIDIAKDGGGFAGFYWPNPNTNTEEFKIAYVKPLGNNVVIAAGYFLK